MDRQGEERGWTVACAVKPTCGQSSGVLSRRDERQRVEVRRRSKHGTLGATQQLVLKPQPVHGTPHPVVVGQLLDGAQWRLETVITAWLRLLKVLQKDYNNKELTNSCHSRTLIVDIFGADVTQHLGGHGLKKMERKRRQRTLILETDFRPSNALLNCFANQFRASTHIDPSVPLCQRNTPPVVQDVSADVVTNWCCS